MECCWSGGIWGGWEARRTGGWEVIWWLVRRCSEEVEFFQWLWWCEVVVGVCGNE